MRGRLFLGTSGYVYPHWRGRFYPPGLPTRDWLPFYARHFATVELNNPFYRLPAREFPRLRSLASALADYDGAVELDEGLDVLLAGLRTGLANAPSQLQ